VVFDNCPRCGVAVVSLGAYGDRTRRDVHEQLVADGVPEHGRFVLEPCGDIIDASQIQLRTVGGVVRIAFES
jgi:hypothetical protein